MHSLVKWSLALLGGAGFLLPLQAQAQAVLLQRCQNDNLGAAQAEARANWARMCALGLNTAGPNSGFDSGVLSANGQTLIDYLEGSAGAHPNGANFYLAGAYEGDINYTYISLIYKSGATIQTTDAYGFRLWSRALERKKARPLYPTYGTTYDIGDSNGRQLFPHPTLGNCALYYDKAATQPASPYGQVFFVNGYCEAS